MDFLIGRKSRHGIITLIGDKGRLYGKKIRYRKSRKEGGKKHKYENLAGYADSCDICGKSNRNHG